MPILGLLASAMSGNLWAPSGAYDSIATVSVGAGGTATISFTSIPATYTHLQIRGFSKSENAGTGEAWTTIALNSDTTNTNYASHQMGGDGATATAQGFNSASAFSRYHFLMPNTANGGGSGSFGVTIVDILDYANTSKNTTVRTLNGWDGNGAGTIRMHSTLWLNTAAVTTISFNNPTADTAEYSQFALYGIKGA